MKFFANLALAFVAVSQIGRIQADSVSTLPSSNIPDFECSIPCGANAYCGIYPGDWGRCYCMDGFEESIDGSGECVQPEGSAIGKTCSVEGMQCKFPNSLCQLGADGTSLICGCQTSSVQQTGQCRKKTQEFCTSDSECVISAVCSNIDATGYGVCACADPHDDLMDGTCKWYIRACQV